MSPFFYLRQNLLRYLSILDQMITFFQCFAKIALQTEPTKITNKKLSLGTVIKQEQDFKPDINMVNQLLIWRAKQIYHTIQNIIFLK